MQTPQKEEQRPVKEYSTTTKEDRLSDASLLEDLPPRINLDFVEEFLKPQAFQWMLIWRWISSLNITVQHSYYAYPISSDRSNLDTTRICLLVFYEDKEESKKNILDELKLCPNSSLVELILLPAHSSESQPFEDRYEEYLMSDSNGFNNSVALMNDPSCVALMNSCEDIVAILPCAVRDRESGALKLCLQTIKTSTRYEDCRNIQNSVYKSIFHRREDGCYITLSTNTECLVVESEGWYLCNRSTLVSSRRTAVSEAPSTGDPSIAVFPGASFAMEGADGYGTLGCVLTETDHPGEELFVLTCEHVIRELLESPSAHPHMNIQFPSTTFRKVSIISETLFNKGRDLRSHHVNRCDKGAFKALLEWPARKFNQLFEATLDGLQHFVNRQWTCEMTLHNAIKLNVNREVVFQEGFAQQINVGGDAELLKIPTEVVEEFLSRFQPHFALSDTIYRCDDSNIFRLQDINAVLPRSDPEREVRLFKLSPFGISTGYCKRLIHIKPEPIYNFPIKEDRYSPSLKRVLLNQLVVYGSTFGISGDSGSLVYAEDNHVLRPFGIFVGSFDNTDQREERYVVTPIEFVINHGFSIFSPTKVEI